jgi:hypothetical protein
MKEQRNTRTTWITTSIWVSVAMTLWACVFAFLKLLHSSEFLAGWGAYVTGMATLALVLAALIAARTAILELRSKRELERAKWLSDLYRDFFQRSQFKDIRSIIDYADLDDIRKLMRIDMEERSKNSKSSLSIEARKSLDRFTDFWNFFEMMGYLCKLEIITKEDVDAMFGYYLKRLKEVDTDFTVRNYLARSDFEHLARLGVSLEQAAKAAGKN